MKQTLSRIEIVALRDGTDCHYCGTPLVVARSAGIEVPFGRQPATLDHVIPASKGGSNEVGNLVLACGRCNNERGDMDYAEFRKLRGLPPRPDLLERASRPASPGNQYQPSGRAKSKSAGTGWEWTGERWERSRWRWPWEAKAAAAREATRLATEAAMLRSVKRSEPKTDSEICPVTVDIPGEEA